MFLARRRREFGEVGCGRHIVLLAVWEFLDEGRIVDRPQCST